MKEPGGKGCAQGRRGRRRLGEMKGERRMHAVESILDRLVVAEEVEEVDVTEVIAGLGGVFVQLVDGASNILKVPHYLSTQGLSGVRIYF